ncbi:sterol desaturase [Monoraphidium neglectum]|uniref:Sterol desaturase n=1 Tax=Monoraphidium neglectum TaxID=145388 RepID=A0A0D2LBD9_9CHLO|nr:sterol desaturase [Monoraphidium neglectum]KIZ04044.1 sterol desaturase [Monoraphidium neglectum]|eukprot:XP_013903063.1 sterol desaturase [Monoraphidium neglectum]
MAAAALQALLRMPLWGGGFLPAFVQLVTFYYLLGLVLHCVVPRLFVVQGIQKEPRGEGEPLRDAIASIGPLAVKAFYWAIVDHMYASGIGQLYSGPVTGARHWGYIALCICVMDYLHDSWFYWTHRLLHWRPLYRWVHWEHHSAFTGYAFHVAEALLVFANELLLPLMFPIHMGLHRIYHLLTTLIHEAGHAGYELSPFIPTIEGLVSVLVAGPRGCLYFTHWDRLCGTMHPCYDAQLFRYFK